MRNVRSTTIALAIGLLLAGLMMGLLAPSLLAQNDSGGPPQAPHTVLAGETLWSLAHEVSPDRDPRDFVYQVRKLNDLDTSTIFPGQRLILPRP
jgi:LysM domain-containing protein